MDKTNTLREATRELGGVSDEEWLALLPALRTRVLEAGEVWIELGEPAGEFGFMLSGLVRKIAGQHDPSRSADFRQPDNVLNVRAEALVMEEHPFATSSGVLQGVGNRFGP